VLVEDESLRPQTLGLIQSLRSAGFALDFAMTRAKPDKQFKRAQDLKARNTLRLERSPNGEVQARIRNLQTRKELVVPSDQASDALRAS
jgi:histidyl-tRNA synthetase